MKRLTLILFAALCIAANLSAQNKPGKGSFGTEIQFNPFEQDGKTFQLAGLKFRYFISDRDAIRLKFGINSTQNKFTDSDSQEENEIKTSYKNEFKSTTGDFNLDLGYERHFDLAKRLNAYVGGSIGYKKHFASTKIEGYSERISESNTSSSKFNGKIKNGAILALDGNWDEEDLLDAVNDPATSGATFTIFTGLDFYLYKGLYIGTEFGLSLKTESSQKAKYTGKSTLNSQGETTITEYDEKMTEKIRQTNVKTYIEPVLRLGWTF